MNATDPPLAAAARCLALAGCLLAATQPVLAQTMAVTTPRLPPRSAVAGPGSPAAPAAPSQAPVQAGAQTGLHTNVHTSMQPGSPSGSPPPAGAYASPSGQGPAYAAYAPTASAAPPAAPVIPLRAEVGTCRAVPTADRQTLMLVSGTAALARGHVPLGEFRAQQVVHSPDGRWAVAYTKLRGAAQFAAMTIDLERCEVQRVLDLSGAGEDVRFEGDDAVLRLADGERRIALRDGRVR